MAAPASKKVVATIKLIINAGVAKPAPPVGPALGQAGLNIMGFCKDFNSKTANYKEGTPMRVRIKVFPDKTYSWELKNPPSTWLIKKAAGLAYAADKPGHEYVGTISLKHIYEIAKLKQMDMPTAPLQSVCSMLLRTCRSMGVKVVARPEDA